MDIHETDEADAAFRDWLQEQEGFSMRTERLQADLGEHTQAAMPWLRAAYGLGRLSGAGQERHGLYTASKALAHGAKWIALREELPVISTWIDEAKPEDVIVWPDLWRRCLHEAGHAQVLMVYAEPGEILKGAWIEVGVALGRGVPVVGVGIDDHTITRSGLILMGETLADGLSLVRAILSGTGPEKLHELRAVRPAAGTCWRHRKGGIYTVIGRIGEELLYVAHADGKAWRRNVSEFMDGRFTPAQQSPLSTEEAAFELRDGALYDALGRGPLDPQAAGFNLA